METQVRGPVRVRFAPSPTGYLHVGGARTAIYNELLRRSLGGSFILRIEDTDLERSNEAMVQQIISALTWLGIEWDEGPFLQSARVEQHRAAARKLMAEGKAYACFRSQEELAAKREELHKRGESYRYRTAFERCPPEEAERRIAAGEPYAIRLRMPDHDIVVDDLVRGRVVFPEESQDDLIILRSDGNPIYHLSVVVDDIDMGITHVIRGEDHLSNTPKHIGLFTALGADLPAFAHLPLILGPDGKKLSKRNGAAAVEDFREQGFLPQTLYNYLALLGWSPGDDRELMSRDELAAAFTVERLGRTASTFDPEKLRWMNVHYLPNLPLAEVMRHVQPFLDEKGYGGDADWVSRVVDMHRIRAKTVPELIAMIGHFFAEGVAYPAEEMAHFLEHGAVPELLDELAARYAALEEFSIASTDTALRALAKERGIKAGQLIHPTRFALSASAAGPPLFDLVAALGREKSAARLRAFAAELRSARPGVAP
jgi:glutamyl-tRNA synthetase